MSDFRFSKHCVRCPALSHWAMVEMRRKSDTERIKQYRGRSARNAASKAVAEMFAGELPVPPCAGKGEPTPGSKEWLEVSEKEWEKNVRGYPAGAVPPHGIPEGSCYCKHCRGTGVQDGQHKDDDAPECGKCKGEGHVKIRKRKE